MEYNYYRISPAILAGIAVAVGGSVVVAIVLHRNHAVPLTRSVWIALSAACAAAVLLITLSPGRAAGTFPCEFSGSAFDWVRGNQSTANVAMLVPVAVALPLATRSTAWYRWSFVALIMLPVLVEATQAIVPLGRACDGMDVVDNWVGVAIGCGLGWVGTHTVLHRPARRSARRFERSDHDS